MILQPSVVTSVSRTSKRLVLNESVVYKCVTHE